eukprot:4364907-Pyramimonas_sp.AAC.1
MCIRDRSSAASARWFAGRHPYEIWLLEFTSWASSSRLPVPRLLEPLALGAPQVAHVMARADEAGARAGMTARAQPATGASTRKRRGLT